MQNKSYIYALSSVLLWSSVATAFKISLKYLTPLQLLFFSSLVSWMILAFLSFMTREIKELKKLDKKQIFLALSLGLINPSLYYLVLFKAYDLLKAQEAQAINYTWALSLSYLSAIFLKQKLRKQDIISGFICYFGVLIIATKGGFNFHFDNLEGIFFALLSTLLWAFYWVANTKSNLPHTLGLFLNFSSGLVLISLVLFFTSSFSIPPLKGLLGATYVGLFEMGITFFLWLKALKHTNNTAKIANLIFISPFLSLVFIYFFLHEAILPSTLLGLCLIIFGLIYQQKR